MAERGLDKYRRMRDPAKTPEPIPADHDPNVPKRPLIFVIQEHHARALHWDFRLEREGVLVSWALPKGVPEDPKVNRLAVHVEDHPLEYKDFSGPIPKDQYGGGHVEIWDHGTYEVQTWTDKEVKIVLHGERTQGRFVLFQTGGKNWMIHRMDAPSRPDWQALPVLSPMLATSGVLPTGKQSGWAYEMKWDGVRAIARIDGGRLTLTSRNGNDMTVSYPELRAQAEAMGSTQAVLDGEIVAFDEHGRPNFGLLQQRMHVSKAADARRLAEVTPAVLLIFDVLHLDGRSLLDSPYHERRKRLDELKINGNSWHVPAAFDGDGDAALELSRQQQLEGVVAKRLSSTYRPGKRSKDWIKVKNIRTQEVVIGGWRTGQGRRSSTIGSLLLGINSADGLQYAGHVGTGFSEAVLADLHRRLTAMTRNTSPFHQQLPTADAKDANWVTPALVGEVAFSEWTTDGRLRHPTWRGLRPDKSPDQVVRES